MWFELASSHHVRSWAVENNKSAHKSRPAQGDPDGFEKNSGIFFQWIWYAQLIIGNVKWKHVGENKGTNENGQEISLILPFYDI
jgi:hypothetical protein